MRIGVALVFGSFVLWLLKRNLWVEKETRQLEKKRKPRKAKKKNQTISVACIEAEHVPRQEESIKKEIKESEEYNEGDRVEANWQNEGKWYPAKIYKKKALGAGRYSYAVHYDDGESETRLEPERLRLLKKEIEKNQVVQTASLPDLNECVAYKKDESSQPIVQPQTQPVIQEKISIFQAKLKEDSDSDTDPTNIILTQDEWKAAAPKPQFPPRLKKEKKEKQSPTSMSTEKNRRKREKQRANKIAVREALRNRPPPSS